MAKRTFSESEAWAILFGGVVIGIVLSSVFWAYTTAPKAIEKLNESTLKEENITYAERPAEFIDFCRKVKGKPEWDNKGFKKCELEDYEQKNLILMNVLCKKYKLNLVYGSFGVKCEGVSK